MGYKEVMSSVIICRGHDLCYYLLSLQPLNDLCGSSYSLS